MMALNDNRYQVTFFRLSLEKISLKTLNQFSLNFEFYETTDTLAKITFQRFIQFFSFLE